MPDVMKTVGRYEILREVGRGGMAMVYLARQTDLDRFVALKELGAFHASDESFAQRFLRESRVAGSLSHPNVVTVHDYFQHDGTPYIAMEYVERGSLRPYVGKMSLAQIGGVLEGLLAGLAHAEQHGIVHRDLKPENLMVTSDGRVKIADFGIAKASTKMQTGAFLTATGTTVGTPTYMAPEQAMAQDIGPWTDLYSVGCMAFEMFTGRVPFHDSDAPMAILLRHVNEPIPAVATIDSSIDQGISDWIEALLVKDPEKRTRSANDAWDEFEEIIIGQLGPRWRREARLMETVEQVNTPKPLTPAPFEGTTADAAVSDEFQSFAWGSAVGSDTAEGAVAPPGPYTPPPGEDAAVPEPPVVGPPTPEPSAVVPAPEAPAPEAPAAEPEAPAAVEGLEDDGFMTFGGPAPSPPTDALIPPPAAAAEAAAAPAAEPEAPAEEATEEQTSGFATYVPPPPARPPSTEPPISVPVEAAAPTPPVEQAPPPPAPPEPPTEVAPPAPEPEPEPEPEPTPVAPEPVAAAAPAESPEVAATVMPDAIQDSLAGPAVPVEKPAKAPKASKPPREPKAPRAEGEKRNIFPFVVGGVAVLAAIVGFLAGGSGGGSKSDTVGPPTVAASSADVTAKVPSGWSKVANPTDVPGLGLSSGAAYAPAGKDGGPAIQLGAVRGGADNSTLLPAALIKAAGGVPKKDAMSIGDGLQAYRYRNVQLDGLSQPVTLYVVPTDKGVATLACVGAETATGCDASANTMALVSAKPFPVGPNAGYGKSVSAIMTGLGKAQQAGQAKLSSAKTPDQQAAATQKLGAAADKASNQIEALQVSPADALVNTQLGKALNQTSKAYESATKAAKQHNKAAFAKASKAVSAAQQDVAKALAGLKAAGYDVKS